MTKTLKWFLLVILTLFTAWKLFFQIAPLEPPKQQLIEEIASPKSDSGQKENLGPKPSIYKRDSALGEIKSTFDKDTQKFISLIESGDIHKTPLRRTIAHLLEGRWISQGDILVPPQELIENLGNAHVKIAKLTKVRLWPNNEVPYVIDISLNPSSIHQAIALMNQNTNIKFVPRDDEKDYIYFKPLMAENCSSFLGRIGGEQEILLNESKCGYGQILHEMMHAVGFVHEHARADRDDYIDIHWHEIPEGLQHQFQKLEADISLPVPGPFDFESILLYSSINSATSDQPVMTKKDGSLFSANRKGLSAGDIEKVNALYP